MMERRKSDMDLNQAIVELIAGVSGLTSKVNTIEPNIRELIDSKLDTVSEKVSNLEKIIQMRQDGIESKMCEHIADAQGIEEQIALHDKLIQGANVYIGKIRNIEDRVTILEDRTTELEGADMKRDSDLVKEFKTTIRIVVYTALGGGLVAFVLFLLDLYMKRGG
jgi:hypothetical protein